MTEEDLLTMQIAETATRLRDLVGLSDADIQAASTATAPLSTVPDAQYSDTYARGKRIYWLAVQRLPWPPDPVLDTEIAVLDGLLSRLRIAIDRKK